MELNQIVKVKNNKIDYREKILTGVKVIKSNFNSPFSVILRSLSVKIIYKFEIKSESSYFKFEIPFPLISAYNDKLTFETPEDCKIFITLKTDDNNSKYVDHRFLLDKKKNLFLTVYCGYIHHEIIKKDFCLIC